MISRWCFNTQARYRDTLTLLPPFASEQAGCAIDRITVKDLTPAIVRKFLDHLEHDRRNRRGRPCHYGRRGPRRNQEVRWRGGRKRALGTRRPMLVPDRANARWSMDFVSDTFTDGRRFRVVPMVDDYTKECPALIADTSLSGLRACREKLRAPLSRLPPLLIGATAPSRPRWRSRGGASRPAWNGTTSRRASPLQNAFVESSSGASATNASLTHCSRRCRKPAAITSWKEGYNHHRPHLALGNMPPVELAMKSTLENRPHEARNQTQDSPSNGGDSGLRSPTLQKARQLTWVELLPSIRWNVRTGRRLE